MSQSDKGSVDGCLLSTKMFIFGHFLSRPPLELHHQYCYHSRTSDAHIHTHTHLHPNVSAQQRAAVHCYLPLCQQYEEQQCSSQLQWAEHTGCARKWSACACNVIMWLYVCVYVCVHSACMCVWKRPKHVVITCLSGIVPAFKPSVFVYARESLSALIHRQLVHIVVHIREIILCLCVKERMERGMRDV